MKNLIPHVLQTVFFPFDKYRLIADFVLLLVDFSNIRVHAFRGYLHVTNRMVPVPFSVFFPKGHAVGHEFSHGWLIVVVSYHPAGNPRGPGPDRPLVYNQDIFSGTGLLVLQFHGQVISGAQAVNACPNDDIFILCWK